MKDFETELLVLALAVGFQTVTNNDSVYLTTIYKNQTRLYAIEETKNSLFNGKADEILQIIDERLEINSSTKDLKKRYDVLYEALGDENHKFWRKAKNNIEGV